MRLNSEAYIKEKAESLVRKFNTRNADRLARELGIIIQYSSFKTQKAAYIIIERNRYIILKDNLPEPMRSIVILHEIGHDQLHRDHATTFKEYSIFDMTGNIMEYEANLFASYIMLPDNEILDYIKQGYSASQIATAMYSDVNLVALKTNELSKRGLNLIIPEHKSNFL